jgi:hypothetical protein
MEAICTTDLNASVYVHTGTSNSIHPSIYSSSPRNRAVVKELANFRRVENSAVIRLVCALKGWGPAIYGPSSSNVR